MWVHRYRLHTCRSAEIRRRSAEIHTKFPEFPDVPRCPAALLWSAIASEENSPQARGILSAFARFIANTAEAGGGPLTDTPGTRMEIRTWRSAIADLKPPPPGAPSGALGEGTPGWVWRCDAASSRYKEKICLFGRFITCSRQTHQNDAIFVNIEGFRPCFSKPSYRVLKWALKARLMQKERLKSPQKSLIIIENQAFGVILAILAKTAILVILASHFRARVDTPTKSTTWGLAQINVTEPHTAVMVPDPPLRRDKFECLGCHDSHKAPDVDFLPGLRLVWHWTNPHVARSR